MATTQTTKSHQENGWLLYALLLVLLVVIITAGYLIFRIFATRVMPDLSAYNLLALSVIAGVASFFSPCAFPLLPGYFSLYYSGVEKASETASTRQSAITLGLAAAFGVITFNLILGVVIGILGASVAQGLSITGSEATFTRFFRGVVGVVLILLGIAQLREVNLKPVLADALAWRTRPRSEDANQHPARSIYLYGLGYNAAGMGCTGPILAGLMIFALGGGGLPSALSAFVVFSVTMGALMILVSALVAASQDTLIRRLKSASPRIKTVSSVLLVVVGLFNIVTSVDVGAFVSLLFP